MAIRQATLAVTRHAHVRAVPSLASIAANRVATRSLSAQAQAHARVSQQVSRDIPVVNVSPKATVTPASAAPRVVGVAESKGRCIGELPTDVIVPNTFNIAKSWAANDVPLSSVTYTFEKEVAQELDAFVLSQCYTSDGLEKLLANGIPDSELKLTKARVPSLLAHIDKVGFLVIKAASSANGLIPPYTHYSSVLISSLLGNLLPQDGEGRKIIGVFQQGNKTMETGARYHQTRQGGSLHTDNVASTRPWDLLFMSCVAPALVGGESIICSSVTLYNFLKQTAPAALETLSKPFIWECRGFAADDYFMAPIFFYKKNPNTGAMEPAIRYLRTYLESAAKRHNRPLTDEQLWAFDVLDAAMEMSQHQFRFFLDVGDHLVMSASQTLHGRTAFIDHTVTSNASLPGASSSSSIQQPNHSPIPTIVSSRFLTRCWIAFPSTPITPILSAPAARTMSTMSSSSRVSIRDRLSRRVMYRSLYGNNGMMKQDFQKRPVASNTTSPGSFNNTTTSATKRLGLRLTEVVNTMMSSSTTMASSSLASLASSQSSSPNSNASSVIIFDKDGTLLCFHSMWGIWIEKQAAQLESLTGLKLADAIYDAVGYNISSQRVRGVDSPLAYATMPTIKGIFESVVTAELHRRDPSISLSVHEATSRSAVSRAWTDEHDLTRVRSTTGSSAELVVLLTSLRHAGFKLAICTADNRVPTLSSLAALGISNMFDIIICGDDGLPAKPNAAIAHHICASLGCNASLSFIVGDTKADISLGVSSGLQSVGVLTGVGSAKDLAAATYIINSVADIIPLVPPLSSTSSSATLSYAGALPRATVSSSHGATYARHMSSSSSPPPAAASSSSSAATGDRAMRGIADVWKLVPNQIDYARIILGMSPLVIPAVHYKWAAAAYLFSHALDQVDGRVARKLKQQSDFGMMLDYTTDIVTQAAMFMKICSIAPYYVIPAAIVVAVESAGMVLAIQASASGRYWKNTDNNTPRILRDYVMKNGVYTPLGDSLVFGHQAFVATTFMCLYNDALVYNGIWWALLPVSLANFSANSAIVYELCRKWQEPARH